MHEMSIAQGIVSAVQDAVKGQQASRVEAVHLEVGGLSCVDTHALEFGFQAVSKGTCLDGAVLKIEQPPGRAQCFGCGNEVPLQRLGDACPKCGSHQLVVIDGEQMRVKSMEVV